MPAFKAITELVDKLALIGTGTDCREKPTGSVLVRLPCGTLPTKVTVVAALKLMKNAVPGARTGSATGLPFHLPVLARNVEIW